MAYARNIPRLHPPRRPAMLFPVRRTRHQPPREERPAPAPGPVTALRENPRRAGRYVVDVAGEPVGPVTAEIIGELGIRMGRVLDDAMLARLLAAARGVACYDKALDALARRSRSRADLGRWLRLRDFTEAEIEPVLDKLTELGLLDDHAFARGFAQSRTVGRGFGRRRVAAELARRGVARETVDEVLSELSDSLDVTEPEAMAKAAEKRARSLEKLEPAVAQRRLFGWLVRRGYDSREAMDLARRIFPAR